MHFTHWQILLTFIGAVMPSTALSTTPPVPAQRSSCMQGLCTTTANLKIGDKHVSIGIAMPPSESGMSEFLVNVSVPLPYGFAAFTMGDSASPFQSLHFGDYGILLDGFSPMNISELRSQIGVQSGSVLISNLGIAKTKISTSSALFPGQLQLVSRIQSPVLQHQPLFTNHSSVLEVTLSMNNPQYLDSTNETAILQLNGSRTASFVVERSDGTFENYMDMVEALGL